MVWWAAMSWSGPHMGAPPLHGSSPHPAAGRQPKQSRASGPLESIERNSTQSSRPRTPGQPNIAVRYIRPRTPGLGRPKLSRRSWSSTLGPVQTTQAVLESPLGPALQPNKAYIEQRAWRHSVTSLRHIQRAWRYSVVTLRRRHSLGSTRLRYTRAWRYSLVRYIRPSPRQPPSHR
jgi:hypothetical protein